MKKIAVFLMMFFAFLCLEQASLAQEGSISIQSEKDWKKYYNEKFKAAQSYEFCVPGRDLVLTVETSPLFVIGNMVSGKGPEIDLLLYENDKPVSKRYRNYRATQQLNRWIVRTASGKDLPSDLRVSEVLTMVHAKVERVEFKDADTVVTLFNDNGVKKGFFVDQIGIPYVEDEKPTPGFEQTMSQALYIYREGDTKMTHFATFIVKFAPDRGELTYKKFRSYSQGEDAVIAPVK